MKEISPLFEGVYDPRRSNATRYESTLSGGETCSDMALYGRLKEDFLRRFLTLRHGIPSHDAFSDLFNALDPENFQTVLLRLVKDFADDLDGVIAIDGKALRRSFDKASKRSALHLVQAFASSTQLVLGQVAVNEKSNEITAMPKLIELLDIKGRIVTADAMHTQRSTSETIVKAGGDYVLALKGNQGAIHEDVKLFFNDDEQIKLCDMAQTIDADHGRIETRIAHITDDIEWLKESYDWPGLCAIGKVTGLRETPDGKTSKHTRYYLLSTALPAERFLSAVRAHWSIENSLHWVLDVTMNEDVLRNRTENGPENLALMRRIALNIARQEPSKGSVRGKIKQAAWSVEFTLDMIRAAVKV
jgi:predicted transposase YbfD/YdcC